MRSDSRHRDEQRLLGVGVPIQRRPSVHLRYRDRIEAHCVDLRRGFSDPGAGVQARIHRLRERVRASPFYRRAWRLSGATPADLQGLGDLAHLPLLSRDELGRCWEEAPSLGIDLMTEAELVVATSSGSSGKALQVVRDGYDQLHMWAAIRFWVELLQVELPPRARVAFVCALPGGLEYSTRLPHAGGGALHRISTHRAGASRRVESIRPAILSADPAGFHWLLAHGARLSPKLLLSSAQHLGQRQREAIAQAMAAPLVNYYATTETGPVAWECLEALGTFHSLQPDVFVESVAGEVVVTRLRDSVLPLVRYRTGDAAEVVEEVCRCGFRGRSLLGFEGRRACHFRRPDGSGVDAWNLIWLFKDLPLVGFRMEQLEVERFEVAVDAPLPMTEALLGARLELALKRLGWSSPQVSIRRVASLPVLAKPQCFVSCADVTVSPPPP